MSWNEYRRRGEVLQFVIAHADMARDGVLPMDLPGVAEHFTDELDLVASLLLRWHSRLSGNLERALATQPMSPEDAVSAAWAQTAEQMPGVRAILDRCAEDPRDEPMADAIQRARDSEWGQLALAAGLTSSARNRQAAVAGRRIEMRARSGLAVVEEPAEPPGQVSASESDAEVEEDTSVRPTPRPDFVERLRAALVA